VPLLPALRIVVFREFPYRYDAPPAASTKTLVFWTKTR
jgi:hypothetical protein